MLHHNKNSIAICKLHRLNGEMTLEETTSYERTIAPHACRWRAVRNRPAAILLDPSTSLRGRLARRPSFHRITHHAVTD